MAIRPGSAVVQPIGVNVTAGTVLAQGSPNACAVQHKRAVEYSAEGLKSMIVIEKMDCRW
jgi:hypothetical protein